MLARRLRFHGYGSLKYLYKHGGTYRSRYFTLRAIANPRRKHSRFTVVVSKKVHKSAVGRNRIRRRVYELLRRHYEAIEGPVDIAVIVTSGEVITAASQILDDTLYGLLIQSKSISLE